MENAYFSNSGTSNIVAHAFRLKPGDDLFKSIQKYVIEKKLKLDLL